MKTFMMTTAIVSLTSFGALAQATDTTGQATTGQATTGQQAQQQQMGQQQHMVPAFLVSDFTGKNLYTLDIDEARQLRDQRMGVGAQPGMQQQAGQQQVGQQQTGQQQTQQQMQQQQAAAPEQHVQQLEQQVQQLQQQVQQLQQAGTDDQQVQQLEQEVQQLQQQVQQLQGQTDQQQIQQVEQQVQQVEQQVQQLQGGQPVQQQAQQQTTQTGTQPGVGTQATQPMQAQYRDRRDTWDQTRLRWESGETFGAQRDQWNDVGSIDDVVMTADGEIRGILIDVGGFLGIGARTVMVDVDELFFVSDFQNGGGWFDDTADDFFVVAAMTEQELEALPEWDENNLRSGFEARGYYGQMQEPGGTMGHDGQVAQQEGRVLGGTTAQQQDPAAQQDQQMAAQQDQQQQQVQQQPQQQQQMARTQAPEGYETMAPEQLTADTLMGADVFDGQNQQIGNVEDLILAADGSAIEAIVLDVGGFLGIGQHRVALQIQEVDIFWGDQQQDVRIQVPMTQQELEQLPEHQA